MTKFGRTAMPLAIAAFAAFPLAASAEMEPSSPAIAVSIGATFADAQPSYEPCMNCIPTYSTLSEMPSMGLGLETLAVSVATGSTAAVANSTAVSAGPITGATANGGAMSGYDNDSLHSAVTLGETGFESEVYVGQESFGTLPLPLPLPELIPTGSICNIRGGAPASDTYRLSDRARTHMVAPTYRSCVFACCSSALLALSGGPAHAQDAVTRDQAFDILTEDGALTGTGRAAPEAGRVVPLTSSFVLNGVTLDYGARGVLSAGLLDGSDRGSEIDFTGTYALRRDLDERIDGTLFQRRQLGWYLQLMSVEDLRVVTTVQDQAGDLRGSRTFLTVTGGCLSADAPEGAFCTFTPGLAVDPDSLDPDTLVPSSFISSSEFEQIISAETQAALEAPGFQRGADIEGEDIGIALDLPNTGFTASEARSGLNGISRYETLEERPVLVLSQVEQNLYSNDSAAALDRTIRSLTLLDRDEWSRTAFALQVAALTLPSFDAALAGGAAAPNLRISNNLFHAANNVRLPTDSITAYLSGTSWVEHSDTPPRSAAETPVAWSNNVWLGFSQVRDIERTTRLRYIPTAPRETVESEFAQGGVGASWDDVIDGTITVIDAIDDQISELDFSEIGDVFVQTGTDVTTQEAIQRVISKEYTDYRFVPHLSLSGNRTDGTSVLRYYTGALLDDGDINAYVGADYTMNDEAGWTSYLRADVYSDPDRDYYSQIEGQLSRRFDLAPGRTLTFGVAAHVDLDRPDLDGDVPSLGDGANSVDLVGRYHRGPLDLTFRQSFANEEDDDSTASTTFGMAYRVSPRLTLSAEHTPYSDEDSYIRARAGFAYALGDRPAAPTLRMQWARTDYDYGKDSVGVGLETSENLFLASLRIRF